MGDQQATTAPLCEWAGLPCSWHRFTHMLIHLFKKSFPRGTHGP